MKRGGGRHQRPSTATGRACSFFDSSAAPSRDSDASFCSSRPSSAGGRPSSQSAASLAPSSHSAALKSLNDYLSRHSADFSLRPPLPSNRDILLALRFLLRCVDLPLLDSEPLEDHLPSLLRLLGYPIKLNKSVLKSPSAPHSWGPLLSVLHWLLQLASYSDHLNNSTSPLSTNTFFSYLYKSYDLFMTGDEDAVAAVDEEYKANYEQAMAKSAAAVTAMEEEANALEAKLQELRSGPSPREALEQQRTVLMEDLNKFQEVVERWTSKLAEMEAEYGKWEKELEAKVRETNRIAEENAGLQRRVDVQAVNVNDVDRMRRELQAVERDVAEAETERNALEERAWELDAEVGRKLKELEVLADQCNQAIRRLKLGNDFQYALNAKGTSPAEVMGGNYKTTLKPALTAFSEDTKKASVSKLEELIILEQQSRENILLLEEKRESLAALQAKIDGAEAQLNLMKKEIEDYASNCAAEAKKAQEEFTTKEQQLIVVEKEAEEFLKNSEQMLQDTTRESDEETQMCARELLLLIDAVSEYKEYMESTTSGMKAGLSETAAGLGKIYKAPVESVKLVSCDLDSSQKRARYPSPSSKFF